MTRSLGIFSQAPCRDCAGSAFQVGALRIHVDIAPAERQRATCFTHRFICWNQTFDTVLIQWTTVKPT
ncbi:hypothetical protein [Pseudomonas avellanae]|uniref:hypothetical protein n=1 Tax=Pseudomonas avellanae TaxID=46257 RepID=UPI000462BA00|nr:hypothetical protein [Pseudomonas avellanae]UQW69517.1 hypothetical protein L2Y00_02955 [Pseudomonas avellanae]UQW75647.1 hypothetical protein L2Y01_07505 [Pseudomonas avellanae]